MRLGSALILLLPALALSRPTRPNPLASYGDGAELAARLPGERAARFLEHHAHLFPADEAHPHDKRAPPLGKPNALDKLKDKAKNVFKKKKNDDGKNDQDDGNKPGPSKITKPPHAVGTNPEPEGYTNENQEAGPVTITRAPKMSLVPITVPELESGLKQIDSALKAAKLPYALFGGAAMMKLGFATRTTTDFDVIFSDTVTNGEAVQALTSRGGSIRSSRLGHVWFEMDGKAIKIDVTMPRLMGTAVDLRDEKQGGDIIEVGTAKTPVLSPKNLLNNKCHAWTVRMDSKKKEQDRRDIRNLMFHLKDKGFKPAKGDLPQATSQFLTAWSKEYPDDDSLAVWKEWGFIN